jgi:aminoglycoside phosphotransferase (APT) family kinase protein
LTTIPEPAAAPAPTGSAPDPAGSAPGPTGCAPDPAGSAPAPSGSAPGPSAGGLLPEGAEPFAFGRDADVYSIDDEWVLRRYRDGHPVRDEAEYMTWVAKYDYPVPAVRQIDGPDMVIERLTGPTLADAVIAGDLSPSDLGRMHADLHRRLHSIPAPSGTSGNVVVHGDLHPYNVILTSAGPVVIDWRNAEEGPPEFDLAMTAIIFAQVALDPAFASLSGMLRESLATYLANSHDLSPGLDAALAARARNPTLSQAELDLLPAQAELIRSHL